MASPLQRTKNEQIESLGRDCGIVERFIHNRNVGYRSDLFGIFDLMSMRPEHGIIGVQCCSTDFSAHLKKITQEKCCTTLKWLASGGRIELWGWRKTKLFRGSKAIRWTPRIKEITVDDL